MLFTCWLNWLACLRVLTFSLTRLALGFLLFGREIVSGSSGNRCPQRRETGSPSSSEVRLYRVARGTGSPTSGCPYLCPYVCPYVCPHVSLCFPMCPYVSLCMSLYVSLCVSLCVLIYVCLYVSLCVSLCVPLWPYVSICVSLCVPMCVPMCP